MWRCQGWPEAVSRENLRRKKKLSDLRNLHAFCGEKYSASLGPAESAACAKTCFRDFAGQSKRCG